LPKVSGIDRLFFLCPSDNTSSKMHASSSRRYCNELSLVALVVCSLIFLQGCTDAEDSVVAAGGCEVTGSGEKVSQTMDLSSYTKITVDKAIEATVVVGDNYAFSINTYKNLLDYLDIQVKDDTLQLSFKKGTCNTNGTAQVTVPAAVVSAALQGASKMVIDRVDGPVSVVGASHFTASVISEGPVTSSGTSHVTINKISPTTTSLTVSAEGASQVTFEDVVVSQATFSVSGASSVTGGNIETLTLDASGASEVDTTVSSKASGSCSGDASITIRGSADKTGISSTGGCAVQAV